MAEYDFDDPKDLRLPNKGTSSMIALRSKKGTIIVPAHNLALEIVLYGDDLRGVADAYEVTVELLVHLSKKHPVLRQEMAEAETLLKKHGRTRMRARDMLEGALLTLQERMSDDTVELKDFTKTVELLAKIADVMPRPDPAAAGVVGAVLNFQVLGAPEALTSEIKPLYAPDAPVREAIIIEDDDE